MSPIAPVLDMAATPEEAEALAAIRPAWDADPQLGRVIARSRPLTRAAVFAAVVNQCEDADAVVAVERPERHLDRQALSGARPAGELDRRAVTLAPAFTTEGRLRVPAVAAALRALVHDLVDRTLALAA